MDSTTDTKKRSDLLFILWAGGAALLSYALVYALRKPFTAAGFDGLEFLGMDYKTAASIIQIAGYVLSKLLGIKFISELKHECRLRFIIGSVAASESSLQLLAEMPRPFNIRFIAGSAPVWYHDSGPQNPAGRALPAGEKERICV